jgi:hypothetical protein
MKKEVAVVVPLKEKNTFPQKHKMKATVILSLTYIARIHIEVRRVPLLNR